MSKRGKRETAVATLAAAIVYAYISYAQNHQPVDIAHPFQGGGSTDSHCYIGDCHGG